MYAQRAVATSEHISRSTVSMSKEALAKVKWNSKVLKRSNMTRPYAVAFSVSLSFITVCYSPTAVEQQQEAQELGNVNRPDDVEQREQESSEKSE